MSERAKMAVRLVIFLLATGMVGFALYYAFFRGTPSVVDNGDPDGGTAVGGLTGSGDAGPRGSDGGGSDDNDDEEDENDGRLEPSKTASGGATLTRLLTTGDVVAPTVTSTGTVAFYDPTDGRFYTVNDNGDVEKLSEQRFPEAEAVTFADSASAAVIEFPDGSNVVYSFTTGKQVTLPSHWEDFSFSDDGQEIALKSVGADPSNRSLVVTSTDGSATSVVAALGANDDKVDVNYSPSGNIVGFSATGTAQSGFGRQELYLIGADGEAAGNLIIEGSNFSAIWAPNGSYILYSVADSSREYRPSLWYADARGDRSGTTRLRIGLETWVEKCVFGSATVLYCAVPQEMVDGGGSDHRMVESSDNLYKIDLPSGRSTLLGYAATQKQMSNLSLSSDGTTLYFQDENGRLNSMKLK